jgi:MFS superfamily sulfate permease-like transporter
MFKHIAKDAPASLVVFLVALPLCLGIALASGAEPIAGLIAGIIGGIIVGTISGSQIGVSGPAAGLAVIVLNGIQSLPSYEVFLLAVVIGGLVQLILGFIKAGIIGFYFPSSVIQGMLSAIGLIIILKQIPHAVGYDDEPEGSLEFAQDATHNTFTDLSFMMDSIQPVALAIAAVGLVLLILWEQPFMKRMQWTQYLPGSLMAVLAGVGIHIATKDGALGLAANHLVQIPELVNGLEDMITVPDFRAWNRGDVWILGVTIAVVASLETLLCVEATDKLDPEKRITPTNRELIAQGTGNVVSGLIGGLPITQVIVRSSANIQSGGKTKLSAIMHGFLLLGSVLLIPDLLTLIPLSSLAAVLLVVGYKLAKPAQFKAIAQQGTRQFLPFIITVLAILFTDLLVGIGIGIVAALLVILYDHFHSPIIDFDIDDKAKSCIVHLGEDVTFMHKVGIRKLFTTIPRDYSVVIEANRTVRMDTDVRLIINEWLDKANEEGWNWSVENGEDDVSRSRPLAKFARKIGK